MTKSSYISTLPIDPPMDVPCPYCKRLAGEWCKPTSKGWKIGNRHQSRIKASQRKRQNEIPIL